jgi:hypothetical protein
LSVSPIWIAAMWHEVLSDALLAIGVIVAGTTLLDMLLGASIKSFIANATIKIWSYLDDLRRIKFIPRLRSDSAVFRMSMLCILINVWIFKDVSEDLLYKISNKIPTITLLILMPLYFTFMVIIPIIIGKIIIPILLRPKTGLIILLLSSIMLIVSGILSFYLVALITNLINGSTSFHWSEFASGYEPTTMTYILLIVGIAIITLSNIVLITELIVLIPVLLSTILFVLLAISEFTLRRIAESPKGPMLAIGGLCGAVASVLKVFAPR